MSKFIVLMKLEYSYVFSYTVKEMSQLITYSLHAFFALSDCIAKNSV